MYTLYTWYIKLIGCSAMVLNSPRDWEKHSKICSAFDSVKEDYAHGTGKERYIQDKILCRR